MKRHFTWWFIVGLVCIVIFGYLTADLNRAATSKINSIATAKAKKIDLPPPQDFRLVVISDLNSQYGSTEYDPEVTQAIALIPEWQPDLVLCGGDMIAGQKASLTKSQIEAMWEAFDRQIAAPLRQETIPLGFTIGNHDGSGAIQDQSLVFQGERNLAQAYWQQHQPQLNFVDRANFPFYYSFQQDIQQDKIFFLVWDASTAQISDQQLAWVEQALKSPAAQEAKARIVLGHLPLYPVAQEKNRPGEYLEFGDKLRSLLTENQVLMYVSGHHHVYYPGEVDSLELLHAGALGQGPRHLINNQSSPRKTITVIDLALPNPKITYRTYDATTWEQISLEQLPPSISHQDGTIWRHDLEVKGLESN